MSLEIKEIESEENSAAASAAVSEERDPACWLELYGDAMYRYAYLQLKNESIAEELVQDSFVSAIKALDSFEGRSSIKTWLFSILRNKIIDHCRKNKRTQFVSFEDFTFKERDTIFNSFGIWQDWVSSWGQHPGEVLEGKEFYKVLEKCVAKLPDKLREVFVLRTIDCLETEEICKQLDVNSSNVWVVMHRARLLMRACIDKNWFEQRR